MTTATVTLTTTKGQKADMNALISSTFGFIPAVVSGDENARLIKVDRTDYIRVIGTGLTYIGENPSAGTITKIELVQETAQGLIVKGTVTLSGGTWNFADIYSASFRDSLFATAMTIQDGAGDDWIIASHLADRVTWKAGGGSINTGGGDDLLLMHTLKRGAKAPDIMLFGSEGHDTLRVTNRFDAQGVLDLSKITMTGFERFVLAAKAELRLAADHLVPSSMDPEAQFQLGKGATLTIIAGDETAIDLDGFAISGPGRVQLFGNQFANVLTGHAASRDLLLGMGSNDQLSGLGGADTLNGGTGHDTLTGGAGADRFVFSRAGGMDVITDFAAGDKIDLRGMDGVTGYADLKKNHATNVGEDVVLRFGQGDQLTLTGISKAELKAEFFLL